MSPDDRSARLLEKLRALGSGFPWVLRRVRGRQYQLYHVFEETEAYREVEDLHWIVDLHALRSENGSDLRGSARFHVLAGESGDAEDRRLAAAREGALRGRGRPFNLPGPGPGYPEVDVLARDELEDPRRTLGRAARDILEAAAARPGVGASHFELVLHDTRTELWNARGLALEGRESLAVAHIVLVAGGPGGSFDRKQEIYRRRLADGHLADTVAEDAGFARDSLSAGLPASGTRPVVVSHAALDFLFAPVLAHAGGAFHFDGLSRFRTGESILDAPARGDTLTLASDGLRPMGVRTRPFSDEGLPPARVDVIERNVFRQVVAPCEFAGALGVPATGPFANLRLEPGTEPLARLLEGGDVLHVVEFSALLPDPVTGDFTGEIRLGYEHGGGGVRPVKGGAVSGNLFRALEETALSSETVFRGDYDGPAALRFEGLRVTG